MILFVREFLKNEIFQNRISKYIKKQKEEVLLR